MNKVFKVTVHYLLLLSLSHVCLSTEKSFAYIIDFHSVDCALRCQLNRLLSIKFAICHCQ